MPNNPCQSTFGNAPCELLYCIACQNQDPSSNPSTRRITYEACSLFPFALKLTCTETTHHPWYICKDCPSMRSRLKDEKQLKRHYRRYHQNIRNDNVNIPRKKTLVEKEYNNTEENNSMHIFEDKESLKSSPPKKHPSFDFQYAREENEVYFREKHCGVAKASMVSYSTLGLRNIYGYMDEDDVNLHLDLGLFYCTLPYISRLMFPKLLTKIEHSLTKKRMKKKYN